MIRIPCPFCGERDHSEFHYGGDGSITYPAFDAPKEDWLNAVYQRKNLAPRQWLSNVVAGRTGHHNP